MAKLFTMIGASLTAALLGGCPYPGAAGGGVSGEGREIEGLRAQVEALSAALGAARLELDQAPARDEIEALERKLAEVDDGAWDAAIELGIAGRFLQADTGLTDAGIRRAAAAVVREARAAGLDPLLVAAVIEVESTYRAYAISPVGAVGLMQVMPATGIWFGKKLGRPVTAREQLFDPERNIHLGVHYLADLKRQFGRLDLALLAYNAGPARARTIAAGPGDRLEGWLDSYARKVLFHHRRFQHQLAQR